MKKENEEKGFELRVTGTHDGEKTSINVSMTGMKEDFIASFVAMMKERRDFQDIVLDSAKQFMMYDIGEMIAEHKGDKLLDELKQMINEK